MALVHFPLPFPSQKVQYVLMRFFTPYPDSASASKRHWPAGKLPVEIFVLIAQFLGSRENVQAMRGVNHEFNSKLASYYFRHLVVHFGPKLNTTLDTGLSLRVNSPSVDITDHLVGSTSIFDNFGPEIRRFALAMELSESDLATPNIDDSHVLEVRPWGIYRWPNQSSQPPSLLQKITEALENSGGMFRILSRLTNVQELGLSCEGRLGYLRGPDVGPLSPCQPLAVFGDSNTPAINQGLAPILDFQKSYPYEMLERMMYTANVPPKYVAEKIDQLLGMEGITKEQLACEERHRCPLPENRRGSRPQFPPCDSCRERSRTLRLQPDLLTEAQKRLLLQHMSAHQALIQSYLLGIMDNAASFVHLTKLKIACLPSLHLDLLCRDDVWSKLPQLEEVSLAVVPDWRKLTEFGPYTVGETQVYPTDALPKVYRLLNDHIGKQQHIKRLHFEWLCGGELAPGRLQRNRNILPAPFLKNHRRIADARMENLLVLPFITHLSLRNCWFTPHVFYRIIRQMATTSLESLALETVSLTSPPACVDKNPVNDRAADPDAAAAAAAAAAGQNPHPPNQAGIVQDMLLPNGAFRAFQGLLHGQDRQIPQHLLNTIASHFSRSGAGPSTPEAPLEAPRPLSWAHIIDMLTPGDTIREHIHNQDSSSDDLEGRLVLRKQLKLRKLTFKSCGYAIIADHRFLSDRAPGLTTREVFDIDLVHSPLYHSGRNPLGCIQWFMQINTDRHLGRIVPYLDKKEERALTRVFGFRTGWQGVYDDHVIRAAVEDDHIFMPGRGRFSGSIDGPAEPTPAERYVGIFYARDEEPRVEDVEDYDTGTLDNDYADETGLGALQGRIESDAGYKVDTSGSTLSSEFPARLGRDIVGGPMPTAAAAAAAVAATVAADQGLDAVDEAVDLAIQAIFNMPAEDE
ncbi:hypothetical protein F4775DRAFT_199748 [Biscogniauxia sp. FL1348]|nr:hypothetical protein F4775DRAFT_199748 [Biscogniauxia sp. FL1348]